MTSADGEVFSPAGPDGKPKPLFDRRTGVIDPAVAQYWVAHYDIALLLQQRWPVERGKLAGKIHIIVGTADNFGLDRSVRLLQSELDALGGDAEFDYAPKADHWTVFDWNGGVFSYIVHEASERL